MKTRQVEKELKKRDKRTGYATDTETRKERRLSTDELSARNIRNIQRAQTIESSISDEQEGTPLILISQMAKRPGYKAARIETIVEDKAADLSKHTAQITTIYLSEEEARKVQENPFLKETDDDGYSTLGLVIDTEQAWDVTYRGEEPGDLMKYNLGDSTTGYLFNPIGGLSRWFHRRQIAADVEQFERAIDEIEIAIEDDVLNPNLRQLVAA